MVAELAVVGAVVSRRVLVGSTVDRVPRFPAGRRHFAARRFFRRPRLHGFGL